MQGYNIKRDLTSQILKDLTFFPVVCLIGPRQCGKSTLAKKLLESFNGHVFLERVLAYAASVKNSHLFNYLSI